MIIEMKKKSSEGYFCCDNCDGEFPLSQQRVTDDDVNLCALCWEICIEQDGDETL